jgi:hypothetical protein
VGDITKNVRNNESPMTTVFGGTVCPPKACRKKERTTTMRVNDVTIINKAGRKERKLIIRKVSINGLLMFLKSMACAGAAVVNMITNRKAIIISSLVKSALND